MFNTHSRRRTRLAVSAAALVTVTALLTACASGDGGDAAEKAPIKVAQISTISGGFPFGDTVKGTQSYINMLNANGGINGHQVEFLSGDDKGDAAEAAQLARKFVQQDGVVGMVGNTSLPDCQANAAFYEQNDIIVVGGGTQNECFNSKNWVPVNAGPFVGHVVMMDYIFNVIKPEVACYIGQNDPSGISYFEQLRKEFEEANGVAFKFATFTNDASLNPTPAVTNAKSEGCDLIMMSTVAPNYAAFIQTAKTVGLDATFIVAGSGYDVTLPATLAELGEPGALGPKSQGVFVAAELAPVDDDNENIAEMIAQFEKDGVDANFWSQIGWLSAKVFFEGLAQDPDADVTTAAGVAEALRAMEPIDTGFAASPLTVGDGDVHAPNLGSRVLLIEGGEFVTAPGQVDGWTVVEPLPARID